MQAVADVVEAIIGAAYISGGTEIAFRATKALGVPLPVAERWSDLRYLMTVPPEHSDIPIGRETTSAIEQITGKRFKIAGLLAHALVRYVNGSSLNRDLHVLGAFSA